METETEARRREEKDIAEEPQRLRQGGHTHARHHHHRDPQQALEAHSRDGKDAGRQIVKIEVQEGWRQQSHNHLHEQCLNPFLQEQHLMLLVLE